MSDQPADDGAGVGRSVGPVGSEDRDVAGVYGDGRFGLITARQLNSPVIGLLPSGDKSYVTDTARIQALLSQPVTCLLGPGTFYCAGLFAAPGAVLAGQGKLATQIVWDHAVADGVLLAAAGSGASQYIGVRDIRLSQANPEPGGVAIQASNWQFSDISRVVIDRTATGAFPAVGVDYNSSVTHYNGLGDATIRCDGRGGIGVRYSGGAHSNFQSNCRILPSTTDPSQIGIYVNAYAMVIIKPDIENAAGIGIYLDVGATLNRPTVIVGEYLEANGADIYVAPGAAPPALGSSRYTIIKSHAESRTSQTALQADGSGYAQPGRSLATTVLRGRTYRVELHLIMDGRSTSSFALAFASPSGAAMSWSVQGLATAGNAAVGSLTVAAATSPAAQRNTGLTGVGAPTAAIVRGILACGATGGTFGLRWAQGIASSTPVTLYAGSSMTIEKVQ